MDGKGGRACLNHKGTGIVILGVTAGGGGESDRKNGSYNLARWPKLYRGASGACRLMAAVFGHCLGYMEKPMTCNCGHPENHKICDRWDCTFLRSSEGDAIRGGRGNLQAGGRPAPPNPQKENLMRTLVLGTALSLALGSAAYAQAVGSVPVGMPCTITALQPSEGAGPNIFWCGPTLAFYTASANYSNPTNVAVWEAIAANVGHMVTGQVGPLGPQAIIGGTVDAQHVINIKVQ